MATFQQMGNVEVKRVLSETVNTNEGWANLCGGSIWKISLPAEYTVLPVLIIVLLEMVLFNVHINLPFFYYASCFFSCFHEDNGSSVAL